MAQYQLFPSNDDKPAIPPVNHVEVLQSGGDVMWAHACGSANGLDADVPLVVAVEVFQDDTFPVGQVGEPAQVRERLFGRPCLAFSSRKQIAEINEKASKSLPLVLGHDHYAGHIILLLAELFLGEVSNQMTAFFIIFCKDIKKEWLNIIIQCFVVQEELG